MDELRRKGLAKLIDEHLPHHADRLLTVRAEGGQDANGRMITFQVTCRLDTAAEVRVYNAGGVLQRFAQDFLEGAA